MMQAMSAYAVFSRDRLTWGDRASDGPEAIVVTDGEQVRILATPPIASVLERLPFTPVPDDPAQVLRQISQQFSSYSHVEGFAYPGTLEETVAWLRERHPELAGR
jgi:hypothetical protein